MNSELAALARKHALSPEVIADLARWAAEASRATLDFSAMDEDAGSEGSSGFDGEDLSTLLASGRIAGRYEDLGPIARGGTGEVRRVRDHSLDRVLAMKIVHAPLLKRPDALERFVAEAKATAQLQHPGIVPVHDLGVLPDGRVWFTMKVIEGRTLAEVIAEVHAQSTEQWVTTASGWDLRRLVDALFDACQAVAFAHEQGVVHRDLKPENTMVGAFGEVYVVDWGLAKLLRPVDDADPYGLDDPSRATIPPVAQKDRLIAGTPAYMAPEQARGEVDQIGPRSDVYSLGTVLYEILSGRPPYEGAPRAVLAQLVAGPPAPVGRVAHSETFGFGISLDELEEAVSGPALPEELVAICDRAMAREAADRYPSATAMAEALNEWLSGSKRREQALAVVSRAETAERDGEALAARAAALRVQAAKCLDGVAPWEPEARKAAGWALEAEADAAEQSARLHSLEVDETLKAAFQFVPDLPEAHRHLVERYRARHAAAEEARDRRGEAEARILLGKHAVALPESDPMRREIAAYLRGDGALTLVTDPPGAEVLLYRYVEQNRRLVEVFERSLGETPLRAVRLPMGSYLCVLRHPDRDEVRYPIEVTRQGHWDGVAPGESEPTPIWLPPKGHLGPDEVYVPAGWFRAGGADSEWLSLPPMRLWCDAFVMDRFPITNAQYLRFLNDLVSAGREDEALEHAPRERSGAEGELGALVYAYEAGRFSLRADAEGDSWQPDWPVIQIDWYGANAYLAWRAEHTGRSWRLPAELEWEKAARGVDGRRFPWGDWVDPSWCRARESARGREHGDFGPAKVDSYPVDVGPSGVRGLGGNTQDWTLYGYEDPIPQPRLLKVAHDSSPPVRGVSVSLRTLRGGSWQYASRLSSPAWRFRLDPRARTEYAGCRGSWTVDDGEWVRFGSTAAECR
jgi:serine/threonine protein kinase/formylglycine-generating enzyme required for sulfatase activity